MSHTNTGSANITSYFLSFFRVPKSVVDKLLKLQHRFLWGGGPEQNKIAWIKWEVVCLPKEKGGLGLKDINRFNLALLGKWKWQLLQQQWELWAKVRESEYGSWRSIEEPGRVHYESIWWRDPKKALHHSDKGSILHNRLRWKVGGGDKIKFWEDRWICQEETLATKYPRLYLISSQQNQTIRQMGTHKDTGWEWNFIWRRPMFDNEIDAAVSFLREVGRKSIQQQGLDVWEWSGDPSGIYSTHSAYICYGRRQ